MTSEPPDELVVTAPLCGHECAGDDVDAGLCPRCQQAPVDPWHGQWVPAQDAVAAATQGIAYRQQRDNARDWAAAWQGEAEAYREVVEALTHEWTAFRSDAGLIADMSPCCPLSPDHPVHRTVAVIQAALMPDDTSTPAAVPATKEGRQQR